MFCENRSIIFPGSRLLAIGIAVTVLAPSLACGNIFINGADPSNIDNGIIGEYTNSGATVNASLVSGFDAQEAMAVSGSDLFVVQDGPNNAPYGPFFGGVSEYTTSGALVNASLVSGLDGPQGIALSGSNLFVTGEGVVEYNASGVLIQLLPTPPWRYVLNA